MNYLILKIVEAFLRLSQSFHFALLEDQSHQYSIHLSLVLDIMSKKLHYDHWDYRKFEDLLGYIEKLLGKEAINQKVGVEHLEVSSVQF